MRAAATGRDRDDAVRRSRGGALTTDFLEAYADAGAKRIVLFSQQMAVEIADHAVADWIERAAGIVERARAL